MSDLNRPLTRSGASDSHVVGGLEAVEFDGALICGTVMKADADMKAKWPGDNPRLPWHANLAGYAGGLTSTQLYAAFAEAWKRWSDFIEIRPEMVQSATEAYIRKAFGREDGPNGVLAWSYLADDTNRPKNQQYDYAENWLYDQVGSNGIDLIRVACHEIGHVLGLDHDSSNANALMRPSYSTSIPKPTERDLQRMVGLGYKRRTAPPVPPAPVPPVPPVPDPPTILGKVGVDVGTGTINYSGGWKVVKS